MKNQPQEHYTPYQLKLPVEIGKIIEISDPVYSFCEAIDHVDLNKYLPVEGRRVGRPRYDEETLLKIILFAFMENGYASVTYIYEKEHVDLNDAYIDGTKSLPMPENTLGFGKRAARKIV